MTSKRLVEAVAKALSWDLDHDYVTKRLLDARWKRKSAGVQSVYLDIAETHLVALRAAGLTVTETKRPARKRAKRG